MSKSKEEIKTILSTDAGKRANSEGYVPRPTHLQVRQYLGEFGDNSKTTRTYDWYDAEAFDAKHL